MDRNEIALRIFCAYMSRTDIGSMVLWDNASGEMKTAFRLADEFIAVSRATAKPAKCEVTDLRPSILDLGEVTGSGRGSL